MKRVLLIEDLSCYGRCSASVALPLFAAAGVEVTFLPTAIFSTHTGVSKDAVCVDFADRMEAFLAHWEKVGLRFDAVLVGYSLGEVQLLKVEAFLRKHPEILTVLDPAMADNGKMYGKLSASYPEGIKRLVALSDYLTPNLTEALILADLPYDKLPEKKEEVETLLQTLVDKYEKAVVITGIRLKDGIYVLGHDGKRLYEGRADRIEKSYSGTGDAFAAIFLSGLLRGKTFGEALEKAAVLTSDAVKRSYLAGMEYLYFESILNDIR